MTDTAPARSREAAAAPRAAGGLRLRIWIASLAGALVSGAGIWWVVGTQLPNGSAVDLAPLVSWLGAIAGLGVVVGAAFALWLDHGLVSHARGLAQALATRQIARLRGLPASSGWGEMSQLTQQIQQLVSQYRGAERAAEELGLLRDQLMALHESLERWNETERWRGPQRESGAAQAVADSLGRGLVRLEEWRDQNLEVARAITRELERGLETARESSEQAERGFIEATALMTTVRELQRLQQELQQTWSAPPSREKEATVLDRARQAIEELVAGSTEAVETLASGMRRIDEIVDQAGLLANRATLVALDSVMAARGEGEAETRRLVEEIRATVDRTSALSRDLAGEVGAATARMQALRERVAQKLEAAPMAEAPERPREDVERLFERVREMVQDATAKGERLSAAGERASRAAETLARALESETREMEGLVARLSPVSEEHETSEAGPRSGDAPGPGSGRGGLRLLGENDVMAESESGRMPEAGEETR